MNTIQYLKELSHYFICCIISLQTRKISHQSSVISLSCRSLKNAYLIPIISNLTSLLVAALNIQEKYLPSLKHDMTCKNLLHCTLASCGAVYCNRSCLWVCDRGRVDGRCLWVCDSGQAVSEPYYSQRACSVCVSLSAFFIHF